MAQAQSVRVSDYTELQLVKGGETERYAIVRSGWPLEDQFEIAAGKTPQEIAAAFRAANPDA